MRLHSIIVLTLCLFTLSSAETHRISRKFDGGSSSRGLRRGLEDSDDTKYSGWKSSYRRSPAASNSAKYRDKTSYYTYMGTLTYYNEYYSREENCGDYMQHDYCLNASKRSKSDTIIALAGVICCCLIVIPCMLCWREDCSCDRVCEDVTNFICCRKLCS